MARLDEITAIRRELLDVARRHGATGLAVFGSVARGMEVSTSDIDFLVTCGPSMSLVDLEALHDALQKRLRARVDVVSLGALRGRARERVLAEAVSL